MRCPDPRLDFGSDPRMYCLGESHTHPQSSCISGSSTVIVLPSVRNRPDIDYTVSCFCLVPLCPPSLGSNKKEIAFLYGLYIASPTHHGAFQLSHAFLSSAVCRTFIFVGDEARADPSYINPRRGLFSFFHDLSVGPIHLFVG